MPTLTAKQVLAHEDLANTISRISPEQKPFLNAIGRTTATNFVHSTVQDTLAPPNKDNANLDGADAADSTLVSVVRVTNWVQNFQKKVKVSGTTRALNTVGSKDEFARQIAKAGSELQRDIEAALVSSNASRDESGSNPRKLGGAEAWITTNAQHGAGGSSPGYSNGIVSSPVAGTNRTFTKAMFDKMAADVFTAGGDPTMVIAPVALKQKISTFATGNGAWNQDASEGTTYQAVDMYVSDFGKHKIIPHLWMTSTTVISFDPALWNLAVYRALSKVDLSKNGDADSKLLVEEVTLECLNEAGNGKVADITA